MLPPRPLPYLVDRPITQKVSGTRWRRYRTPSSSIFASLSKPQKNCAFITVSLFGPYRCVVASHAPSATLSWTTAAAVSSFSTSSTAAYSASTAANCNPAHLPPRHSPARLLLHLTTNPLFFSPSATARKLPAPSASFTRPTSSTGACENWLKGGGLAR